MTGKPLPTGFGSQAVGTTLHLAPQQVWDEQRGTPFYRPSRLSEDGFVHCTNGEEKLLEVANLFYRDVPGSFLVLDIDLSLVTALAIYEDPGRIFPHIYGPIDRDAVIRVRTVERDADGAFVSLGDKQGSMPT